jgi:hypothetical protein
MNLTTWTNLRDTVLHNLLAGQVGLVADEQLVYTLGSIAVDFLQPLLHVGERIYKHIYERKLVQTTTRPKEPTVVCDIINDNDTVCSTVV